MPSWQFFSWSRAVIFQAGGCSMEGPARAESENNLVHVNFQISTFNVQRCLFPFSGRKLRKGWIKLRFFHISSEIVNISLWSNVCLSVHRAFTSRSSDNLDLLPSTSQDESLPSTTSYCMESLLEIYNHKLPTELVQAPSNGLSSKVELSYRRFWVGLAVGWFNECRWGSISYVHSTYVHLCLKFYVCFR